MAGLQATEPTQGPAGHCWGAEAGSPAAFNPLCPESHSAPRSPVHAPFRMVKADETPPLGAAFGVKNLKEWGLWVTHLLLAPVCSQMNVHKGLISFAIALKTNCIFFFNNLRV